MFFALIFLWSSLMNAAEVDISHANLYMSSDINESMQKTVMKIIEKEIGSVAVWNQTRGLKNSKINIAIITNEALQNTNIPFPSDRKEATASLGDEGFYLTQELGLTHHTIWLVATNRRSIVFALGALCRKASIYPDRITLDDEIEILTAPAYAIRGHQLGYRHKANSYDAWSVDQYDTYIRELALFGTNAIENIPLGSSKDDSPHMQLSRAQMNRQISAICDSYDLDYWVWIPATFDLTDSLKRSEALKDHELFYKDCPRLNNVFVPGGDPGHNHPRHVLPFLKELSSSLKKYHPEAGIWISLQGFTQEQIDYFYTFLDQKSPAWLKGVVTGPSSPSLSETRYRLPKKYQHRHYPDITHNVRCDYPVQDWDQAFAHTLGREGSNPQPDYYARVHAQYAPFTDGFITYSDGAHDDVNKFIWSQRGWEPGTEVREILVDYCRFFFGPEIADKAADGILGLERNWVGALATNGGVEMTFSFWQRLEHEYPGLQSNWRWQLLLIRAYYDTYVRRRLIQEQALESKANEILLYATEKGSRHVMDQSLYMLQESERNPVASKLKSKSINMQTYCSKVWDSRRGSMHTMPVELNEAVLWILWIIR